jgi:Fe-S-cluster containining protein
MIEACNRINEKYIPNDEQFYKRLDLLLENEELSADELLVQAYLELNSVIDREIEMVEENVKISKSCESGCSHCCYFPTIVSNLEAKILTEYIISKPEVLNHMSVYFSRNAEVLQKACEIDFKSDKNYKINYLKEQVPCPFLDIESNSCVIYEARPSACRTYVNYCSPKVCEGISIPEEPLSFDFMHEFYFDALNELIQTLLDNGEELSFIKYPNDAYEYGYLPVLIALNLRSR